MFKTSLEIQPTEDGSELSWYFFMQKKICPANRFEIKTGLTVRITDVISQIITIANSIDPQCKKSILSYKGFTFPDFEIEIISKRFTIYAKKTFSGGNSRERVFNYKVTIEISSKSNKNVAQVTNPHHQSKHFL